MQLVIKSVYELGHVFAGLWVVDEGGVGAGCSPNCTAFRCVAKTCDTGVEAVELVDNLAITSPYFQGLIKTT